MKAVLYEVGKNPKFVEVSSLKEMQTLVGGYIDIVHICEYADKSIDIVVNDEGLINGMEINRPVGGHLIYGDFILIAHNQDGVHIDLTPNMYLKAKDYIY